MSDQFVSVRMVSQLELPVTSLAKALNDIFCPFRFGGFFCFVSLIVFIKEKLQRKEPKESQEALYKKEKIIAGRHNVLEVKDCSHLLGIFSRMWMYTSTRRMGKEGLTLCGVQTKEYRSFSLRIKWSMEIKLSSQCRGEFLSRMDHSMVVTVKRFSLLLPCSTGLLLEEHN